MKVGMFSGLKAAAVAAAKEKVAASEAWAKPGSGVYEEGWLSPYLPVPPSAFCPPGCFYSEHGG